MRKHLVGLACVMILTGCGPRSGGRGESRKSDPFNLQVEVNDKQMTLSWMRPSGKMISGFNIYISEEPLAARFPGSRIDRSIKPYNRAPFPGDTNPEDGIEHFTADGLDNGVRYYVSVRTVFPDGSMSKSSREIRTICGPRGEIELAIRYQGKPDGFSFERNDAVEADASENDLYFYSKDDVDQIASPKRLNGFLNDSKFLVVANGSTLAEVSARIATAKMAAAEDQVEISKGDWVLLRTATGRHALLNVRALEGTGSTRRVTLFYAYSTLQGEVFF